MTKQFNGIFRTWTRVRHARHGALPVLWGDCIVHLSHPEFSGNILHTSGIIDIVEHGGFKIAQTRNNYYALLGPELQMPPVMVSIPRLSFSDIAAARRRLMSMRALR